MLSKTSEYALQIMVALAKQSSHQYLTGAALAKISRVPKAYLAKILQSLNRAELVQAQKGKGGGYALNRTPDKISLFDIIQAVDPFIKIAKCPLGIAGHACPLREKLHSVYAEFRKIFESCALDHFVQNAVQPKSCRHHDC